MNILAVLLAACLVSGLVVAAVLLWVGINAMVHGRGLSREAAMTVASLSRALRSIYNDTLRESLPNDFIVLLGKLARPGRREPRRGALRFN